MKRMEKLLVGMTLLVLCLSVLTNFQRDRAVRERDEAKQETREIAALYNGVLIGRGCEIPE
jgi:hypothetical protein